MQMYRWRKHETPANGLGGVSLPGGWWQIRAAYLASAKPCLNVTAWDGLDVVNIVAFPTGIRLTVLEAFAVWCAVVNTAALRDVHPSGEIGLC
ncbi:hypothetical protein GCM10019016_013340 [Streptomyces prasinosporus]|uniref:Uncharacterized protein n=1 Tax=Streptomyces prasinosporus TaxID=68256 RepID=A0ABP6THB4_9ACTN